VDVVRLPIDAIYEYEFWSFNGTVPGPFIRARVGDVLEVTLTNNDASGMQHNIDFHAVTGPGGGAPLLVTDTGKCNLSRFRLTQPGLFIYHCSVEPLAVHVANGMYGMILVEPEEGLPPVDREFYVLQSEIYAEDPQGEVDPADSKLKEISLDALDASNPQYVVFNGRVGAMTERDESTGQGGPLRVKTGETVRLFVGNAGPNLTSAFHVIGAILDRVYREGDLKSPPAMAVQTTVVPPGGATMVEFQPLVPGTYTIIDHAVIRVSKGAVGFINAEGPDRPDLYYSTEPPRPCPGCSTHQ